MKINIKIRSKPHPLECEPNDTIKNVKEKLIKAYPELNATPEAIKVVRSGKVIEDTQTLQDLNVVEGDSLFALVTTAMKKEAPKDITVPTSQPSASHQPAYPPPPSFNMPSSGGMNNDAMRGAMEQQLNQILENPNMLDLYFGGMMQGKTEEEKEQWRKTIISQLHAMKENPDLMNTVMNQMGSMDPRTLNNMMGNGGGFGPGAGMAPPPAQPMGYYPPPQYGYQQAYAPPMPQPSPTVPCSHGFFPYGYVVSTPSPASMVNYEEKYAEQLRVMNDMGFTNKDMNIKALVKANGDVNVAIDIIISSGNL